jgi:hypothetical protein
MSNKPEERNRLADAIEQLAAVISPPGSSAGQGQGGPVNSLIEANMDIAYSLNQIAKAINYFAEEVADIKVMLDSKLEDK